MTAPPRSARAQILGLAAVTLLALALRVAGLATQPLSSDDFNVGLTADSFTSEGWPEPTMWNHPRLRDHLVEGSLHLFGQGSWGIRTWSVALGTLSVPAVALLVLAVGGSAGAALLSALLLAVDPLHVDFSRQGINDVHLAFFPVAAFAAAWRYRATRSPPWLVAAGLLVGLGIATKWIAAFPAALAAGVILFEATRRREPLGERRAEVAFVIATLAILPLAIYLATFLPWFGRGHGLGEWLRFQASMALETATHAGYAGTKRPGYVGEIVRAWRWFVQPAYYVDEVPMLGDRPNEFVVGVGNPLAWLAVWPAASVALWRAWRHRDRASALLLALFALVYLPLLVSARPIWTNTALAVLPFAMALVGSAAAWAARSWRGPVGLWLAGVAAGAALLWAPAVHVQTELTDRVVRALIPPEAYLPHPPQEP